MTSKILPRLYLTTLVLVAASYVPNSPKVAGQVVDLSGLRHENIPLYERKIAGDGNVARAPRSLAFVIGDSRLNHWAHVTDVEFSSDGRLLASSSSDGTVRFWDLTRGEEVRRFTMTPRWQSGPNALSDIALSSDGRWLAAACDNVGVVIWSVQSGKEHRLLRPSQAQEVGSVVFHPTRPLIASTHRGEARLWNVETGEVVHQFRSRPGIPGQSTLTATVLVEFAIDGETLVMGNPDGSIQFRNVESGREIDVLDKPADKAAQPVAVSSLAVSNDGMLLAAGYADGTTNVWQVDDGELLFSKPQAHKRTVQAVGFQPDRMVLASGGLDGRIRFWNLESGDLNLDIEASRFIGVESLSFQPRGNVLASGGLGVRLWDSESGEPHLNGNGHAGGIVSFDVSSDGATITTGGDDGMVIRWDTLSGESKSVIDVGRASVAGLDVSLDGKSLATLEFGGVVKLWNLETQTIQKSWSVSPHSDFAHAIALSPNDRWIAAAGRFRPHGQTALIDVRSGAVYGNTKIARCSVLGFSSDGDSMITAGRSIGVWNAPDLKHGVATDHLVDIFDPRAAAISPDGKTVAVSGSTMNHQRSTDQRHKHAIVLCDVGNQDVRSVVDLGSKPARLMAFSLEGTKLAVVCGRENVLRVLDVNEREIGDEMRIAPPGNFVVRGIQFLPDEEYLAAAMGNGTVCIHHLSGSQ